MDTAKRYCVNKPSVVSETIEGEAVMINLDTGVYYSTNAVGASLWDLFHQPASAGDVVAALKTRFSAGEDELLTAVTVFGARLLGENLICEAPADAPRAAPPAPAAGAALPPFAAPTLEKYADLQDLLLADPIHDVDETGWPHGKPA